MRRIFLVVCVTILGAHLALAQNGGADASKGSVSQYAVQIQRLLSYEQHFQNVADRVAFRTLIDSLSTQPNRCTTESVCAGRSPSSGAEIAEIENSLRTSPIDADRNAVLRVAARSHCLSTRQIRRLVVSVKAMDQRIDLLATLHPRVTDPKRFHTVLDLLDSSEARQKLLKALDKKTVSPSVGEVPGTPPARRSQ